jgi:glycosyltransferase involved in cell wall biosynthesis
MNACEAGETTRAREEGPGETPGMNISVVIPTFQRVDVAVRAVRSALEQTEPPLEVIVCDDASIDATEATFKAWAARDQRVRYLRNARNAGTPAVGRNAGVAAARGDWIAFLDDDDSWLPHKLERQRPYLDRGVVVAGNAQRLSHTEPHVPDVSVESYLGIEDVVTGNPVIQSTAVTERDAVIRVGGFPQATWLRGVEDYVLWLKLADHGFRFTVLPEPLALYEDRQIGGRLSTARARRQAAVACYLLKRLAGRPRDRAAARAALRHTIVAAHVGHDVWKQRAARRPA